MNEKFDIFEAIERLSKEIKPDDSIDEITSKIMRQKNQIIDLFCKAFFVSQEPKSPEEMRAIFEIFELECNITDIMNCKYSLKLKKL